MSVKCRNCINIFRIKIKLNFGARKNKGEINLLDCLLSEVRFYFKCPYCKQDPAVSAVFFSDKRPEISQIVENPHYTG